MKIGKFYVELRGQGISAVYCFYVAGKKAKVAGTNLAGQLPVWQIPLMAGEKQKVAILTAYAATL